MPIGTATARLRKSLLFEFAKRLELDTCYRCGEKIQNIEEFSIEHIRSWQWSNDPVQMFFDLSNIAFSHLVCNVSAARAKPKVHSKWWYNRGCRCVACTTNNARKVREWRYKTGRRKPRIKA